MYLETIISFSILYISYLSYNSNILNDINIKYNKWKRLKSLVATKHKSTFMIYYVSIEMILTMYYSELIKYLNKSVHKIGKNRYEVSFTINEKHYKMVVKPDKGPPKILMITDKNNEDVSDLIFPYLGPNHNWFNNFFSPSFFGYDELNFELNDGSKINFKNSEIIIV